MFSTRKLAILAAGMTALFGAGAAFAGTMVVRSTGPSAGAYPAGKQLASDGKIVLKAGDVVTVLDAGGTRVLKGPGAVAVAGSKVASGSGFAQLIANTGARQARTGATRSAVGGGAPRSPNVWYVDASRGGNQCLVDPAGVALWRPNNTAQGVVTVTRLADGKSVGVDFRAGQSVRPWPLAELPIAEGAQFKLDGAGAKAPVTVKATMVSLANPELDGVAAALLPKGCANQLDVLVEGSVQEGQQLASAAR